MKQTHVLDALLLRRICRIGKRLPDVVVTLILQSAVLSAAPVEAPFVRLPFEPRLVGLAFERMKTAPGTLEARTSAEVQESTLDSPKACRSQLLRFVDADLGLSAGRLTMFLDDLVEAVFGQPPDFANFSKPGLAVAPLRHCGRFTPRLRLLHLCGKTERSVERRVVKLTAELKLAPKDPIVEAVDSERKLQHKRRRGGFGRHAQSLPMLRDAFFVFSNFSNAEQKASIRHDL